MISRASSKVISLALCCSSAFALHAQQPKAPTLDEILQRLEDNLNHYDTSVPSFFCDEHLISKVESNRSDRTTVTDSIFRLKRIPDVSDASALVESRDIRTVDGKAATSQKMSGPVMVDGAFEGGLAVVSVNQKACMKYTLAKIDKNKPDAPYLIRFETKLTPGNTAACLLQEETKGQALIDPASMQMKHLEFTTPHHVIIPQISYQAPVIGKRVLTVDYAPVVLDEKTFWMPTKITMNAIAGAGTYHADAWLFEAAYRNYHLLEVKSRVHMGNGEPIH